MRNTCISSLSTDINNINTNSNNNNNNNVINNNNNSNKVIINNNNNNNLIHLDCQHAILKFTFRGVLSDFGCIVLK